ncbi:MAG: phage tail protein [Candidatus Paceibacterota bacterium]
MATPYMNLDLPVPGVTDGPDWAEKEVTAFETVDAHDHSPGKGTPVPSAGISIDADLDFDNNKLTAVQAVNLEDQDSALSAANVQSVYAVDGDLWYNNSSGTPVQITQGSSIASASSPLVPSGVIWPYGGSSAPTGFLMCDGSAVSRTTYADLFAAIGTTYGVGNGSSTFNLPNAQGRAPIGAGTYTDTVSGSVTRTLGASLGAEKHVITVAEMASHNHGGGSHTHLIAVTGSSTATLTTQSIAVTRDNSSDSPNYQLEGRAGTPDAGTSGSSGTIITTQGSGTAHNNMQPSFVTNFIIKT